MHVNRICLHAYIEILTPQLFDLLNYMFKHSSNQKLLRAEYKNVSFLMKFLPVMMTSVQLPLVEYRRQSLVVAHVSRSTLHLNS